MAKNHFNNNYCINIQQPKRRGQNMKTKNNQDYGYVKGSLIGRYLVDQGVTDSRAVKLSKGLDQFINAYSFCDKRNTKILKELPHFALFIEELERLTEET